REQLGRRSPARLILEIDIGERLPSWSRTTKQASNSPQGVAANTDMLRGTTHFVMACTPPTVIVTASAAAPAPWRSSPQPAAPSCGRGLGLVDGRASSRWLTDC